VKYAQVAVGGDKGQATQRLTSQMELAALESFATTSHRYCTNAPDLGMYQYCMQVQVLYDCRECTRDTANAGGMTSPVHHGGRLMSIQHEYEN
jgi:hypothetical protein